MADKKEIQPQGPAKTERSEREKPQGFLHSIVVIVLAFLVVAVVTLGVFYFMAKNNVNGFAETLKPHIGNYPILKHFMPKNMPEFDPEDPMYLTNKEILEKYKEYREKVSDLNISLEEANQAIEELKKDGDSLVEQQIKIEESKLILEEIEAQREALKEDQKALEDLILQGDKEGFAAYFQKVNKATAEAVYAEIAKDMIIDEEKLILAEPFSKMDAQRAANMFSEMYTQDVEAMLDIFEGMQPKVMAPILEKMDSKLAAEVYSLLAERRLSK